MGRPFTKELLAIEETYYAALKCNTDKLTDFIKDSLDNSTLAVGSGGSYSVASVFALMIQQLGGFAKAVTPYDLYMERNNLRTSNVIFFTASGRNSDVNNAYKYVIQHEPENIFVLCMKKGSRLIDLLKSNNDHNYLEFTIPNGKDGFLAVNSSIAMLTIFYKIYCEITCDILDDFRINSDINEDINDKKEVLNKQTLITLGGNWTMPVVYDFESKCTEAGLSNIQCANFRNFAHGRHHWIAKHMDDTGLICFISPDERDLALKTLEVIPKKVPKIIIETNNSGLLSTIDLMVQMYYLVNKIGEIKGIDPGRPGVPDFGRKIYHISYSCESLDKELIKYKRSTKNRSVMRKISCVKNYNRDFFEKIYFDAYNRVVSDLKDISFKSLVLDYDNTIIKKNDINDIVYRTIISRLIELAKLGIHIAFATGRGKSIRVQLQTLIPENEWQLFWIAYYNGACIGNLADNSQPKLDGLANDEIKELSIILKDDPFFSNEEMDLRATQISIKTDKLKIKQQKIKLDEMILEGKYSLRTITSDHSIDVIPKDVSKNGIVKFLQEIYGENVLCIGDAGDVHGNDFDLLNNKFSFSVDKTSLAVDSCWNVVPLGLSGPSATLYYLENLTLNENGLKINKVL